MVKIEESKKERLPPQTFQHVTDLLVCTFWSRLYVTTQLYIYLPDFYANILCVEDRP